MPAAEEDTYRLTDMEFDEVSLCVSGVNGPSSIVLSKALPKKNKDPENCTLDHSKNPKGLPCPECGTKAKMSKAVAGSYEQRIERVRNALNKKYPRTEGGPYRWVYPRATFDTAVIYSLEESDVQTYWMAEYSFGDDGMVVLTDPVEVEFAEIAYPKAAVSKAIADNDAAIAIAQNEAMLAKANPQGINQFTKGRSAKRAVQGTHTPAKMKRMTDDEKSAYAKMTDPKTVQGVQSRRNRDDAANGRRGMVKW